MCDSDRVSKWCVIYSHFSYIVISCGSDFLDFVHVSAAVLNELLVWKSETIGDVCETKTIHNYTLHKTDVFRGAHSASGGCVPG